MSKTITLPTAGELAISTSEVFTKLPTEALHNHFHQLSENAAAAQEEMAAISLSCLLLCASELEHQKKVHHGEPWKAWVKSNCQFGYTTATKYAKALKCARDGLITGLSPDLLPETPPSLMSKDELNETCKSLSEAMRGLGGRRQLYLQLEIIALPGATPDNSKHKPPSEERDIEELFYTPLKKIEKLFTGKKHLKLTPTKARELEAVLTSYLDDLKLIK